MTIIGQEELSEEEEAAAGRGKTGNQLAPPPAAAAVSQLAIGETLQLAIVETSHNAMPYFLYNTSSHNITASLHNSVCCPLILFFLARGYKERKNIAMQSFSL